MFINYRTQDGGYAAGLLDQRLRQEFGDDLVFRDNTSMRPGVDFPPELRRRLELSTVMLVLIGPDWLTATDDSGSVRVQNPLDYVRREIEASLERDIHVIPLLMTGATLPRKHELPPGMAGLSERQYMHLRVRNADTDLQLIVDELARHLPSGKEPDSPVPGAVQSSTVRIDGDNHRFEGPVIGGVFNGQ